MSRTWFSQELETVAVWWQIFRRDGIALGFTTHDADLWFDGLLHRASPGMMPSAIRRTSDIQGDSAEATGAISSEAIAAADLAAGRFDGAEVVIGLLDWQTLQREAIYRGMIGSVSEDGGSFTAQLLSRKVELQQDPIPRTSPTCRAEFCGPGCGLSAARFTHEAITTAVATSHGGLAVATPVDIGLLGGGSLRWLDGPYAGLSTLIAAVDDGHLLLDMPLDATVPEGARAQVREGCDRTLETCAGRFANALNFQGEPFLPGNDLLTRYGVGG